MWQHFDKTDRVVFYIIFLGHFYAFMRVLVVFQSAITTVFGTSHSRRGTNNDIWTLGSKGMKIIQPHFFLFFFLAWMVTYLPNSPTETEWGPFSAGRGAISKITSYYLKDISSLLLNYNAPTIGLYTRLFFPEKMANNFGYLSLTEMG